MLPKKPRQIRIGFRSGKVPIIYDIANNENVTDQVFNFQFPISPNPFVELFEINAQGLFFHRPGESFAAKEPNADVVEITGGWKR